jgi:uncharacterized protein
VGNAAATHDAGAPRILGHAIVSDPTSTERRAVELAQQNVRFRVWIKGFDDLDDTDLDSLVRATADEVWEHIDCQSCGRCCRLDEITVDQKDIARLARRLKMTGVEFTRRYIRSTQGEMGMKAAPCPFFGASKCTVYEHRPQTCRDFPFLHSSGFRYRLLVLIEFSPLCPVIFNTLEVLKRRMGWSHRGRR